MRVSSIDAMEFAQKIEVILVERPPSAYDVMMESPLQTSGGGDRHARAALKQDQTTPPNGDKMISSLNSTLEDTTPSDSGVQMMDSESSEVMVESITSQTGLEFEEVRPAAAAIDANANAMVAEAPGVEDVMNESLCSTFDTTENIVYRRKARKVPATPKAPKKRVSFHEDILKNTRTDNIHIEHGFITYKNGRKMSPHVALAGRYSWCAAGDGSAGGKAAQKGAFTELCARQQDDEEEEEGGERRRRCVVYRNACSDVLDYGNSDVYDTNEGRCLRYDNSGVFEYVPQAAGDGESVGAREPLYRCSCSSSSSNSSLDSEESDKNCNRPPYGQAKSSSCDCIGMSQANNNTIGEHCYYSEPNMENLKERNGPKKSVWNKEKKPKSSCLKKTKRPTDIIDEQDLTRRVKKFNVHDVNQLLDNSSKILIGSLKSIFAIPLPERGVPEGSEDVQAVVECLPEAELEVKPPRTEGRSTAYPVGPPSPPLKSKPFLSKSLDGSKRSPSGGGNFVHNVDEQLRRKHPQDLFGPTRQSSTEGAEREQRAECDAEAVALALQRNEPPPPPPPQQSQQQQQQNFRNKFIINCESTVFEHTGVSYENAQQSFTPPPPCSVQEAPVAQPERDHLRSAFGSAPFAKTFSNFFRSLKESATSPTTATGDRRASVKEQEQRTAELLAQKPKQKAATEVAGGAKSVMPSATSSSSIVSEATTTSRPSHTSTGSSTGAQLLPPPPPVRGQDLERHSRHLPSPMKKRATQPRYGVSLGGCTDSSELFGGHHYVGARGGTGRDSKSTILSEDFDDLLTITTEDSDAATDRQDSEMVIVDYAELPVDGSHLLKPPAAKTSLINRFLRNVTQKKILESSLRQNNFFAGKLRSEQRMRSGPLYVRGGRVQNAELIDDLNAEIALEMEMSGSATNSPRHELVCLERNGDGGGDALELHFAQHRGMGEVPLDVFNGNYAHILRDPNEQPMKVFKLYTGYSREGFMNPVLVFLTDRGFYVADLVRNRLCTKFALAYADLDVILLGPFGNTVLLCNGARDQQQVLLAGGPYPAASFVAHLELCARRSGATLPAVGQMTLAHLEPLQAFVRANCNVGQNDSWQFYAVVHVPLNVGLSGTGGEREPLGPHVKGFLMHRRIRGGHTQAPKQSWQPGYFLLKAGVLYMFQDSTQKLPSWAMALAECQGARRALKGAGRPHCFEVMLKGEVLQLAAPDEYVASEWLQALLQSASGLFELQERHKTLGCTLVLTQHHLVTLREDFAAPLRQLHKAEPVDHASGDPEDREAAGNDFGSLLSSSLCSSLNSTPTRASQLSRSTTTGCGSTFNSSREGMAAQAEARRLALESYAHMSSCYGKNAGLEILTCAAIKEMTGIKIPSHNDTWWCILEFSCQEVVESSDDLVVFFADSAEMQRFLRLLEQLWQAKNNDLFPITILDEEEPIAEHCSSLYLDIDRAWEPLLTAAMGYPL